MMPSLRALIAVSSIKKGLVVLVGIGTDDTTDDMTMLCNKILSLRVFADLADPQKMWKASVKDIDGEILSVSQFTLMANTAKGSKPDFHAAMSAEHSQTLYQSFLDKLGQLYKPEKIKDGRFGAMMNVSLTNEGPVTFTLDSRKFKYIDAGGEHQSSSRFSKTKANSATATAKSDIAVEP